MLGRRNFVLGSLLCLAGCAVHRECARGNFDPFYVKGNIKSLAVFPVYNGSKVSSYLPQLQNSLALSMQQKNPTITVLNASQCLSRLNNFDALADASRFMSVFFNTGTVDFSVMKKVQKALSVDAALLFGFTELHQNDGVFFRGRGHARIKAQLSVVDLHNGQIVWTGDAMQWFATSNFGIHRAPEFTKPINELTSKLNDLVPML